MCKVHMTAYLEVEGACRITVRFRGQVLPHLLTILQLDNGEIPITLIRPDRTVSQHQKKPFQFVVLLSIVLCWGVSIDMGVSTSLSIKFVDTPTMERTFVELFNCSIRRERLM
jgi:hypothetical protein